MKIEEGFNCIPKPILDFVKNSSGNRPTIPNLFHISGIVYCLGKEYYSRTIAMNKEADIEGQFNMFRGRVFDGLYSPLFELNQNTEVITRDNISLTGTYDFVYDGYLWDLKIPKSIYYKKKSGAGQGYIRQVKAYLAMNHFNNKLLDINKAYILMIAGDGILRTEVDADNDKEFLDWLFKRAFALRDDINSSEPDKIREFDCPEEKWECDEKYCQYSAICVLKKG